MAAFLVTVSGVIGLAISEIGDPVESPQKCGRSEPSYVCDPDELLTAEEGKLRYHCLSLPCYSLSKSCLTNLLELLESYDHETGKEDYLRPSEHIG